MFIKTTLTPSEKSLFFKIKRKYKYKIVSPSSKSKNMEII